MSGLEQGPDRLLVGVGGARMSWRGKEPMDDPVRDRVLVELAYGVHARRHVLLGDLAAEIGLPEMAGDQG